MPSRRLRPPAICAALAVLLCGSAHAQRQSKQETENLVRANLSSTKQCSKNFRWRFDRSGGMRGNYFQSCMLSVNGAGFPEDRSARMTADGLEYVLSGQVGTTAITRRFRFDAARSATRYIEIFENRGTRVQEVKASLLTQFPGRSQQVFSNTGAPVAGTLGKKDIGVVLPTPQGLPSSMGNVLFLLAGERTKLKPQVAQQGNDSITITYTFKVRPKQRVSILHVMAQRHGVTPANAPGAFAEFYAKRKLLQPAIPQYLRKTIANFRVTARIGGPRIAASAMQGVTELAEILGIELGPADILVLGEDSRIAGTAACDTLAVTTPFGEAAVDFKDVAALIGGGGAGRPMRVYLRNGEILTGPITAEGLELKTEGGVTIPLSPESLGVLMLRVSPADGVLPAASVAFLTTCRGEKLALDEEEVVDLNLVTAWGPLAVELSWPERLVYLRDPQLGHRLMLNDGSSLSVMLQPTTLDLNTIRFGELRLSPRDVAALSWIRGKKKAPPPAEEATEEGMKDLPEEIRGKLLAKKLSWNLEEKPLTEAVADLQKELDLTINFDLQVLEEVADKRISLTVEGTAEEVLIRITQAAGLKLDYRGAGLFMTAQSPQPEEETVDPDSDDSDKETEEPPKPQAGPHWILGGENVLVGPTTLAELNVVTRVGVTTVETPTVVSLSREEDDSESGFGPIFRLELTDGSALLGSLEERVIPVRCDGTLLAVPIHHVVSYAVTKPPELEQ